MFNYENAYINLDLNLNVCSRKLINLIYKNVYGKF